MAVMIEDIEKILKYFKINAIHEQVFSECEHYRKELWGVNFSSSIDSLKLYLSPVIMPKKDAVIAKKYFCEDILRLSGVDLSFLMKNNAVFPLDKSIVFSADTRKRSTRFTFRILEEDFGKAQNAINTFSDACLSTFPRVVRDISSYIGTVVSPSHFPLYVFGLSAFDNRIVSVKYYIAIWKEHISNSMATIYPGKKIVDNVLEYALTLLGVERRIIDRVSKYSLILYTISKFDFLGLDVKEGTVSKIKLYFKINEADENTLFNAVGIVSNDINKHNGLEAVDMGCFLEVSNVFRCSGFSSHILGVDLSVERISGMKMYFKKK